MPVSPKPSFKPTRAVVVAATAVVAALIAIIAISQLSSNSGGQVISLGSDDLFNAGDAKTLAEKIGDLDEGGPLLFPDPKESDRSIFLQNLNSQSPLNGESWTAFSAHNNDCADSMEWQAGSKTFADPCNAEVEISGDGCGADVQIPHYEVRVENGQVLVDVRNPVSDFCVEAG